MKYVLSLTSILLSAFSCSFLIERGLPVISAPVFDISSGVYNNVITVNISCETKNAKIIYTIDGTMPSKDNGFIYNNPITLLNSTTVKAIAIKDLWMDSKVSESQYTILGAIIVKHGTTILADVTGDYMITSYTLNTPLEIPFTISNVGNSLITIKEIVLDTTPDYYSITKPDIKKIPSGFDISFTVKFLPLQKGKTSAFVKILSDDIARGLYSFNITGNIVTDNSGDPEISLTYSNQNIESNKYSYDFGLVNTGIDLTSDIFTIRNYGYGDLVLRGNPKIQLIGLDTKNFTIIEPVSSIIKPGDFETFRIIYSPKQISVASADIIIPNNDKDEYLFTFNIKGKGADKTPPQFESNLIDISNVTYESVRLNWIKAADNISNKSKLKYLAYYSLNLAMNSVNVIETNGTPVGSYTEDIEKMDVVGLLSSSDYYFNVIVMDEAGNKSSYALKKQKTNVKILLVGEINTVGDSTPSELKVYQGQIYFSATNGIIGRSLWRSNGTDISMVSGSENTNPSDFVEFNGKLYFAGESLTYGKELWSYDGTNSPSQVFDIYTGANSSSPAYPAVFDSKLYFKATEATTGAELWSYNGSGSPTIVYDLFTGVNSANPEYLTVFNNKLVFSANDGIKGSELWSYNGVNPPSLYDHSPNANSSNPKYFIEFNGNLYYSGQKNDNNTEIYKYNGSSASIVYEINPTGNSNPSNFTVYNDKLYFSANNGTNGVELWCYDGINPPAMVWDINKADSSNPCFLKVCKNKLYFSANDGINGVELWYYDGINPPAMVWDINPMGSANPEFLTVYNNMLYFSAKDNTHGTELWKLDF
ncbi:MAG TPA: chitobiase/beta-hexosaminidase C-terminal domain-containing protein [Spirochaetota bacterium]|nr:chitobiase/beta-hexosaminidase C-terminal domain-containing protein [Spirochaetota bacterium]